MSQPYSTIPATARVKPSPYTIKVPEDRVSKLKQLVHLSEVGPGTFESTNGGHKYGLSRSWLEAAKAEWETTYDWRAQEKSCNSFPNYTTIVEQNGYKFNVHFIALFSEREDALPLVLLHGWPGSFLEFLGLLEIVKKRYSPSTLPYHLIVPSLPGWGFSSPPPPERDFFCEDAVEILNSLMVSLGFGTGYVAQGGDIGSYIARIMGAQFKECTAVHINYCFMSEPEDVGPDEVTEDEQTGLLRARDFATFGVGYGIEHATRPSTIGLVLQSSPVAFLAWIAEKFESWSDVTPSTTEILSTASLYWLTQTISTSIYTYRQLTPPPVLLPPPKRSGAIAGRKLPERADGSERKAQGHDSPEWHVEKPLGYSWFPKELGPMPVAWVKRTGQLVWWRRHDRGGHFAALEQPALLLDDIEDFVKQVTRQK